IKKNDKRPVKWTPKALEAFELCKQSVAKAALISHPVPNAALALVCDASDSAIGAVLEQQLGVTWKPLGFFSRKLSNTEKNYSTYDLELLAIYDAIRHFKLMARVFVIKTDHKPLIYAFQQKPEKASTRQLRHVDFIGQFSTNIIHIAGPENSVADELSRISAISMPTAVSLARIEEAQSDDTELTELLQGNTALKLYSFPFKTTLKSTATSSMGLIGHMCHTPFDIPFSQQSMDYLTPVSALMCSREVPWIDLLPTVLLGLRTCYKEDLGTSTAEFLYGNHICLPNEFY
ncbi:hypothetical protein KR222_005726, partial [Zaprionus bogoriensis]